MRHALHFRQQQAEQRLLGNRTRKTLQTTGTAQQEHEIALQTLGFMRGHERDVHLRLLKEHDAAGVLVDLEQTIAVVAQQQVQVTSVPSQHQHRRGFR